MAATILTESDFQYLVQLKNDATTKANDPATSPRLATHLRNVAKLHGDFIAVENGKRAAQAERDQNKAQRERERLARQKARLEKMTAQLNQTQAPGQSTPGGQAGRQNKAEKSA